MKLRQKEQKVKTPFFQEWYQEGKKRKWRRTILSKPSLASITLFIVFSYLLFVIGMGHAAHGYSEENYNKIEEQIYNNIGVDIGINVMALREHVEYNLDDRKGKNTKLVVNIGDGHFNAEVIAILEDNYQIKETIRNYTSIDSYMLEFWKYFTCFFLVGFGLWFVCITVLHYLLSIIAWFSKRRYNKKNLVINETHEQDM